MRFNVAIRTLTLGENGSLSCPVGSAVVADSRAQEEYEECLLKARFLRARRFRADRDPSVDPRGRLLARHGHRARLAHSAEARLRPSPATFNGRWRRPAPGRRLRPARAAGLAPRRFSGRLRGPLSPELEDSFPGASPSRACASTCAIPCCATRPPAARFTRTPSPPPTRTKSCSSTSATKSAKARGRICSSSATACC